MAPPLGFTLRWIQSGLLNHCQRLRRKRFVELDHVDVSSVSPANFSALGIAYTGPIPNSSGGHPAVA